MLSKNQGETQKGMNFKNKSAILISVNSFRIDQIIVRIYDKCIGKNFANQQSEYEHDAVSTISVHCEVETGIAQRLATNPRNVMEDCWLVAEL